MLTGSQQRNNYLKVSQTSGQQNMSGTSQNSARNFAWPKQKKGICVNEGVVLEGQGQKEQQQHPLFLLGHLPQTQQISQTAQLQCYRPPPIHVPYNHESGILTPTVKQSKSRAMLLASKSSFQLNQPSSFWQADSFLHQQHLQAVAIQQLKVQPPTHQQLPSTLQLPASVPQQSSSALQSNLHHFMGDQVSFKSSTWSYAWLKSNVVEIAAITYCIRPWE